MINVPLSWGKPKLFIAKITDGTRGDWVQLATPIEDSTNLATTQGDKMEAKIEGGENEAVKYKKNTYQLTYNIRKAMGRNQPAPNNDGVVTGEYAVLLQPEDPSTDGFFIERTAMNIQDNFTTAEGAIWNVTHDALSPSKGNTVKWGTVTVEDETTKTINFAENSEMAADPSDTYSFDRAETWAYND